MDLCHDLQYFRDRFSCLFHGVVLLFSMQRKSKVGKYFKPYNFDVWWVCTVQNVFWNPANGRVLNKELWHLYMKSLMAEWLEQASQWHEMYYHDLEIMSSNPGRVELRVLGTSILSQTWIRIYISFGWLVNRQPWPTNCMIRMSDRCLLIHQCSIDESHTKQCYTQNTDK